MRTTLICSKCHLDNDRSPQRYCSGCHMIYMRGFRAKQREEIEYLRKAFSRETNQMQEAG